MRGPLSYAEAVRILGGSESRIVNLLDRLAGAGVVAGGLDLLDMREEAVRYGHSMTRNLSERLSGISRLTRTERLRAAHTVIVLTAYFDALEQAVPDLGLGKLKAGDQLSLGDASVSVDGRRDIASALTRMEVPGPGPSQARDSLLEDIRAFYLRLGRNILFLVGDLESWDELDEARRDRMSRTLWAAVPDQAVVNYEELYRRLALDCPEFQVWTGEHEQRSARAELRDGMARLERLLLSMTDGRPDGDHRGPLSRSYQAALDKPIAAGGDIPSGLRIPTLRDGYLDHRIRVATADGPVRPSEDHWWERIPVRDDPTGFLAAYLTCAQATSTPLLVLGQPGSGKSVLTRVLSARLPAADFLPVRVELRQAPTEVDLQTRIEDAIRQTTGEQISWPRLVDSCQGTLPVVLLDGFDELLQATGVTQTDFLMRVAAFQEREADQGRPVAVIVTSRTAVANRARIPQGSLVVRLEPFDDEQIRAWLDRWDTLNTDALRAQGLQPLPARIALAHRELAEQPLLLLMLALYDADDNGLQRRSEGFERTELYEHLLREFAGRQVRKHAPQLDAEEYRDAVENELLRLSIVGFAMFNRNTQWVSEADLDSDLRILFDARHAPPQDATGLRAPLSAAQTVIGRFFFVHQTQVTRDGLPLQTYEFLHATFGEFLVARLVVQILVDMAALERAATRSPLTPGANDGLLHALLSHSGLTAREPIITFLADLISGLDQELRATLGNLLLRLHRQALHERAGSAYDRYRPRPLPVPDRHAAWSLNLVAMVVLVCGELTGSQLFPDSPNTAQAWRSQATLWRSRLLGDAWWGFFISFRLRREWNDARRDIRLSLGSDENPPSPDIFWTYAWRTHPQGLVTSYDGHSPLSVLLKSNMVCSGTDDVMVHALRPVFDAFPSKANLFVAVTEGRTISATHALLAAVVAKTRDGGCQQECEELAIVLAAIARQGTEDDVSYTRTAMDVLLSAIHSGAASEDCLAPLQVPLSSGATMLTELMDLIRRP